MPEKFHKVFGLEVCTTSPNMTKAEFNDNVAEKLRNLQKDLNKDGWFVYRITPLSLEVK